MKMSGNTTLAAGGTKGLTKIRNFLHYAWEVLMAMDDGPYGFMDDRVTALEKRIKQLEAAQSKAR